MSEFPGGRLLTADEAHEARIRAKRAWATTVLNTSLSTIEKQMLISPSVLDAWWPTQEVSAA